MSINQKLNLVLFSDKHIRPAVGPHLLLEPRQLFLQLGPPQPHPPGVGADRQPVDLDQQRPVALLSLRQPGDPLVVRQQPVAGWTVRVGGGGQGGSLGISPFSLGVGLH